MPDAYDGFSGRTCRGVLAASLLLAAATVLTDPRQKGADGGTTPLTRGRLQIQSEGAEVYYRNLAIRRITEFPKGYRPLTGAPDTPSLIGAGRAD